MDIQFAEVDAALHDRTLRRIVDFFGFHAGLVEVESTESLEEAEVTLTEWQSEEHLVRAVVVDDADVGFIHLWHKGPIVMWIEDLYLDPGVRGRGIGAAAIRAAEEWIESHYPDVEAISMDVAPRNGAAVHLYHRLGYDAISLLTLRRQIRGEDRRDRQLRFADLEWRW